MSKSSKLLRALILGAPGSGKGTISSRISRDFNLKHLASGDLLRNQITLKTDAGIKAESYMSSGKLVPDDIIVGLISNELRKLNQSWLLDGFPRTLTQAESLNKLLDVDVVLNLDVPFKTIQERLEGRWIHQPSGRVYHLTWNPPKTLGVDNITGEKLTQREDDKPETVQNRLRLYEEMTLPLLEYYRKLGLLQTFHGTESDVIYPDINSFLKQLGEDGALKSKKP